MWKNCVHYFILILQTLAKSKVSRPEDAAFLIIAAGGILELLGNGRTHRDSGGFISAYY